MHAQTMHMAQARQDVAERRFAIRSNAGEPSPSETRWRLAVGWYEYLCGQIKSPVGAVLGVGVGLGVDVGVAVAVGLGVAVAVAVGVGVGVGLPQGGAGDSGLLRKIATVSDKDAVTARSGRPFRSKSPTATVCGSLSVW